MKLTFFKEIIILKVVDLTNVTQHTLHCEAKLQYNARTVWKLWKFTVTRLRQKFRENNVFTKEVTKELI